MDTIRNRCLPINLSLARAQIRIHPPTVRDSERNRLQGSSWLPQGQMRCAISEILGLTSSKKLASPRSVASWPGKYGYPSLACGDRVTGHNHRGRINPPRPPSGSRNFRARRLHAHLLRRGPDVEVGVEDLAGGRGRGRAVARRGSGHGGGNGGGEEQPPPCRWGREGEEGAGGGGGEGGQEPARGGRW